MRLIFVKLQKTKNVSNGLILLVFSLHTFFFGVLQSASQPFSIAGVTADDCKKLIAVKAGYRTVLKVMPKLAGVEGELAWY